MKTIRTTCSSLLLLLTLTACQSTGPGPQSVVVERSAFNAAIQQTDAEQLLLNIVRLRYVDTPQFLELTSIASQVEVEVGGSLSADIVEASTDELGLGTSITVTRAPTVSYVPLQGEEFVRQLLTPIDGRTLVLLYHSGWAVDRLFRLSLQSLGSLPNAPRASGPTPASEPEFASFLEAVALLRELQLDGRLRLGQGTGQEGAIPLVLEFDLPRPTDPNDPARDLRERLGVPLDQERIVLSNVFVGGSENYPVLSRSLMAILFYAAQAVRVPEDALAAGHATRTVADDGTEFDWSQIFDGLLDIRVSKTFPDHAYVTVRHRNHWFFIADDDLDSKATFTLLDQLFALQAGTRQSSAPVLTLPIGR
ncbi:MAG: hypothetical protein ACYSWX_14725 [Planctomycetota bacterium]